MRTRLSLVVGCVWIFASAWSQMIVDDFGFLATSPTSRWGMLALFQGEKVESPSTPELHPLYKIEFFYQETKNPWTTRIVGNFSPISANFQMGVFCTFANILGIDMRFPFALTVGTGWYDPLFGKGIGIVSNFYDPNNIDNTYSSENLSKIYFKASTGIRLSQNLVPNTLAWTVEQILYYRYFLGTKSDMDVWLYENQGDNLKYFRYSASGMITLKLPLLFRRISLFVTGDWDIQHYSTSLAREGGWGSDLPRVQIGGVFGVGVNTTSLDLQLTWGNTPAYQEGYGYNLLLTKRRIHPDILQYWYLQKIALLFSWEI
ncbi:MAG: hypothetical protein N2314_03025 [Brevinematales bacterium]|nr:hypothetical protein [Brevinematales bacterium]